MGRRLLTGRRVPVLIKPYSSMISYYVMVCQLNTQTRARKDRKREARRQSLVDAAKRLFVEKGFAGTTIDDIIEAADVAKVTFYYYFKSKEEMALEMKRQCHEEAVEYIAAMRSKNQSADEMINAIIHDIVVWTEENWRLLEVFCVQRFSPLVKFEDAECKPEPLTLCIDAIIQRGQEQGTFRADFDTLKVAQLLDLAILCEQHAWVRNGKKKDALRPSLKNCFDFALNGILKRACACSSDV